MQDKQNKGIGAYKDRPGYFMGGMIGGAILGALVNKIQGKDWKKGALWGGIGGGIGSWAGKAFMPAGVAKAGSPTLMAGWNKLPWYQKMLATAGSKFGVPAAVAGTGAATGAAAAWMAGDDEYDKRKAEEYRRQQRMEQMARNKSMYGKWYVNPWTGEEMNPHLGGYNTGGAISSRPGYPGGGSATLEYTDPDLYTPTGEGKGPTSKPIINIPLGPEPSFADEFEDLELASGPGQGDMSGWYEMYEDLKGKGELPDWMDSFDIFMQNLDMLDISPTDFSAQGGYKTRPQYQGGGTTMTDEEKANVQGLIDIGYSEDEAIRLVLNPGPEFLKSPSLGPKYTPGGKAEGGIADLDMTGGGASFGPGTGTSDDIPAMLSDGEFVVTAKAVENLGGGDRMLGAKKMYSMMNQLDPNSQTPAEMNTVGIA